MHSTSENSQVGEKCNISCECRKTSPLEGSSDYQKCHMCMSYCNLCGEGLKESGCHNQVCHIASGASVDNGENAILLEDVGKELHEVFIKEEIDIDEIPPENQVSEEFEFTLVKSEFESDSF